MLRPTAPRTVSYVSILCLVALLASCGGGGSDGAAAPDGAAAAAQPGQKALAVAAPALGVWSAPTPLPLVPVSIANRPDGKLLLWSSEEKFSFGQSDGRTYSLVYDPATGAIAENTVTQTNHNMFCVGTTYLADGRLLINGGITPSKTSLYSPATGAWTAGADMNLGRGYQANTLLQNGSVLTLGGSWAGGVGGKHAETWSPTSSAWTRLPGVPIEPFLSADASRNWAIDVHFWLLPAGNGKVFHAGPGVNMHWIGTTGIGGVTDVGPRADDAVSLLGTTVMYDTGKILKTGGAALYDGAPSNANTYVIDVNAGVNVRKVAPMAYQRAFQSGVVLPNGQVMIIGGQSVAIGFSDTNSILPAELWDPTTERFTTLPPISVPRNYHSVALLLPDARVVSAGGGLCGAGCWANHPDLQIYTPHYLLNPDGSAAKRPVITAAPAHWQYGTKVSVGTDSAIASFAMVRLSATTHTVNNDQRRLSLTFRAAGANSYEVDVPSNPGWALPGDWMLFAMNADGTPSVAKIVRVTLDGAPAIQSIDDQVSNVGASVSVQPVVTLPAGAGSPVYSATGLPPGISVDPATGRFSGKATGAGRHAVTLRASAGAVTVSTDFVWTTAIPGTTRYVKLEVLSQASGEPGTAVAELNLLGPGGRVLPRSGWRASADSAETTAPPYPAADAIDGNPGSFWHTQFVGGLPLPPHSLVIDMGAAAEVVGLRYLPRQDGYYGRVGSYNVYLSVDGVTWGSPVASGNMTDLDPDPAAERTIYFGNAARGKPAAGSSLDFGGEPARAVDGNIDGNWYNNSVTHTGANPNEWWEVDLGQVHALEAVRLWNRTDALPERLGNFYVLASDLPMQGRTLAELLADPNVWRSPYPGTAPRTVLVNTVAAHGRYVRVQLAGTNYLSLAEVQVFGRPFDNHPPTLTAPAPLTTETGAAASLSVAASDPDGDVLTYSASGLPAGLSIAPVTGIISGRPTAAGTTEVTIVADDGRGGSAAVKFNWTVLDAVAQLQPVTIAPAVSGTTVTYNAATANLGSYQYQWTFGDGSAATAWSTSPTATHTYAAAGAYQVTVTARTSDGRIASRSFLQAVQGTVGLGGSSSSPIAFVPSTSGTSRVWVVNPDNDSVSVFDAATQTRLAEISVGSRPRTLAPAPDGRVWVVNGGGDSGAASISILSPTTLAVVQTVPLARGSQPFGIVIAADGYAYVAHEAGGTISRLTAAGALDRSFDVGPNVRHLALTAGASQILASRFITPPLPGEGAAAVQTRVAGAPRGGELLILNLATQRTVVLQHSERGDGEVQGRGIPNYLGAPVVSPDGRSAWVPSKQDNILRGALRDGLPLNFQNTVRAIISRVDLASQTEELAARVDLDNASLASAAAFHPSGAYLFVALETSRQIAVLDAVGRRELFRVDAGRAPQGLAVSADGLRLYVSNFMDRSVGAYDIGPLLRTGESVLPLRTTMASVVTDKLGATVLQGKQLFYDARDPRLARDGYMSCASCHSDGGHDGRTWDLTSQGEGLRNTVALRGRAGAQGRLHWSGNFDEVQDFEGQIRTLAGGTGLMTDAQFATGTRSQPLGDPKAGVSADLDALAAYVGSLGSFAPSPLRSAAGTLTTDAAAGKTVFAARCASCHSGTDFSDSAKAVLHDIGTFKPASGQRLGRALNGIDTPTLRDAWATAPYLHDGSAATLEDAIRAHRGLTLSAADLATVAAYTRQIGSDESAAPASEANLIVRALATLADFIGALFEVQVDGAVVGRGQLDATGFVDLLFDTSTFAAGASIDVLFLNDGSLGTQDRNFAAQSITLNTAAGGMTTIASTSAGVTIDVGDGAAALDGFGTFDAASTGGWLPWNAALRFKAPGVAGASDTIVVRAATSLAGGVGAAMELRVNGVLMGTRTLTNTAPADLSFAVPTVLPGDRVDVVFTNDAMIGGEDRNLYIESITARGLVIAATAPGVTLDPGTGATATDGVDAMPAGTYGGWVPWNAAMRFTLPAAGSTDTIVVRAAASLAGGVGAQMQVLHQGVLIGSKTVGNTAPQDFSFTTPSPVAAGDRIDIVFTNDTFIAGEDRNLVVTSVRAHGATLLPTDPTATLDPGDGAAAFDGVGVLAGGVYGGWIPWNGALRMVAR